MCCARLVASMRLAMMMLPRGGGGMCLCSDSGLWGISNGDITHSCYSNCVDSASPPPTPTAPQASSSSLLVCCANMVHGGRDSTRDRLTVYLCRLRARIRRAKSHLADAVGWYKLSVTSCSVGVCSTKQPPPHHLTLAREHHTRRRTQMRQIAPD